MEGGHYGKASGSRGPGQDPTLAAFTVALQQASDGERWYTSTEELQMTSMQFCVACRSVTTLTLTVNSRTPARLLAAAADASYSRQKRFCSSLVPRLRARQLVWKLQTANKLRKTTHAFASASSIVFCASFVGSLEGIAWPNRLKLLKFEYFGKYDAPIAGVAWPKSLERIDFGVEFNQPVEGVRWPASLQRLSFGHLFDQPVEGVAWPDSMTHIAFGERFNQPVEGVRWPSALQELTFGDAFNQPIKAVAWPKLLRRLEFGEAFDQRLEGVAWPPSLEELTFGENFNWPVDEVTWPGSLRSLFVGRVSEDCWPNKRIYFASRFDQAIERAAWPGSLRQLSLGDQYEQSLKGLGSWMPNLEELAFFPDRRSDYGRLLSGIEWPRGLRRLTVYEDADLDSVEVPPSVKVFRRRGPGAFASPLGPSHA
ncbi:unnamed protein product [Scytosiphon promiscuus]